METRSKQDNRFSAAERSTLATVPWIVGAAVSEVDKTGGSVAASKEMVAINDAVHSGIAAFSSETMIDLVAEPERIQWVTAKAEVVARCTQAMALLSAKATPEETEAYRKLIMDVAHNTARAAGESFQGLGKKVSALENSMIDTIAKAIGAAHLKAR